MYIIQTIHKNKKQFTFQTPSKHRINVADAFSVGAGELLTDKLLTFDAKTMDFRKINVHRRESCPICGSKPTITKLIDYE